MKKERIGFDFDKIFVDYPPFIPGKLIEFFYKKHTHSLSYRIPGKFEQKLRIASHTPLFRPALEKNIRTLKKIYDSNNFQIYLVSSRFSFLRERTKAWNKKNKISDFFEKMYFNYNDEQPHEFKSKIIRQEKITKFVDDDLSLLIYLSKQNPDVKFYWITSSKHPSRLPGNVKKIKTLDEFYKKYL